MGKPRKMQQTFSRTLPTIDSVFGDDYYMRTHQEPWEGHQEIYQCRCRVFKFQGAQNALICSGPPSVYATPKVTKYQRCNFIIQIHKFTIKINTICINLLFECVKIVEFNFNSHVFLVMYQEICFPKQDACFFLNQDVCFLKQEERRQFLISSVSERD